jgi:hypothetical protein
VSGPKHTGLLGKRRDSVLDDLRFLRDLRLVVRHVEVIAADQAHAQHDLCRGQSPQVEPPGSTLNIGDVIRWGGPFADRARGRSQ